MVNENVLVIFEQGIFFEFCGMLDVSKFFDLYFILLRCNDIVIDLKEYSDRWLGLIFKVKCSL